MKWVKPQFGSGRINAAGKALVARKSSGKVRMSLDDAVSIAANWRSSHAYPLQALAAILRRRAKQVDPSAVVVQRLKRMPSIVSKLERFGHMELSQMHDLGGCRAIVRSLERVHELASVYEQVSIGSASFYKKYDYISKPKEDGYRGIHLVYRYHSDHPQRALYNGQRIEIQIRSHYQHAWATAVETVDTFTKQALKSGIGSDSWKRFFVLMGIVIDYLERQMGDSVGDPKEVDLSTFVDSMVEVNALLEDLKVEEVLSHLTVVMESLPDFSPTPSFKVECYLLTLDLAHEDTKVLAFADSASAAEWYMQSEKANIDKPFIQTVLVSADSISALRKAYPNYWQDSTAFISCVNAVRRAWKANRNAIIKAKS